MHVLIRKLRQELDESQTPVMLEYNEGEFIVMGRDATSTKVAAS